MDGRERRAFTRRIRVLLLLFLGGLCMVALRTAALQIWDHAYLAKLARDETLKDVRVPARRGHIYDRNGKALAISVDVPSVYANPTQVAHPRQAARQLAEALDVDASRIWKRLARDRLFVWLKRRVSPKVAERVKALRIEGVGITMEPKRFYPNREVGAHVLGFAGLDSRGLEGVERAYDEVLRGEPQVIEAVRDARGRAVFHHGVGPDGQASGADVHLTLDLQIQHAAEAALLEVVRSTKAVSAQAVVLDVPTAEVLAMAVVPRFNPNDAAKYDVEQRRNRTVTDMLEPGSTLKPLVVAAALDAGVISPSEAIFCENGSMRIGRHTIRDSKPHAWIGLRTLIAKSSNIGAAKVGQALGAERLHATLRQLRFGERAAIGFPGEARGMLRPAKMWSEMGTATISFGHGVAVSTLQLAAAYRVLAARGRYLRPTLLRYVAHKNGRQRTPGRPSEASVLGSGAVRRVVSMMQSVVSDQGTGVLAAVPGFPVAGKTGTAQKVDPVAGGYSNDRFVALFAGFLPAKAPRAVVVVVVDEPRTEHTGGLVAAPAFATIAGAAMRQLGVVPVGGVSASAARAASAAAVALAGATAAPVASDMSEPADTGLDDGRLPSFIGLTSRQAVERYVELALGLDLQMEGSGNVVRQHPKPGTDRATATRVRLVLARQ